MSDFKVGDTVYFMYSQYFRKWGEDDIIVYHDTLELLNGLVVKMCEDKDFTHVYVDGAESILIFSYFCFDDNVFKSKKDCIDAFKKRLDEL